MPETSIIHSDSIIHSLLQLLIGETSGKELMPVFVDSVDLETLNQVIKKENIDPEDEVVGSYTKDENNIPPRAVLTVSHRFDMRCSFLSHIV